MTYKEDLIKRTAEKTGKSEKIVADIIYHHYKYLEELATDDSTYAIQIPNIGTLSLNYLASKAVKKTNLSRLQRKIFTKAKNMKGNISMAAPNFITPHFIGVYMRENLDFVKDSINQLKPLYEEYSKKYNELAKKCFFGT